MCRVKDWRSHLQGMGIHEEKAAERVWECEPGTQLQLSTDWINHIHQATKFAHERKNLAWGYLEFAFVISVSFLFAETLQIWSSTDGWTRQCPLQSFLVSLSFHLKDLLKIFFVISERTGWLQKVTSLQRRLTCFTCRYALVSLLKRSQLWGQGAQYRLQRIILHFCIL